MSDLEGYLDVKRPSEKDWHIRFCTLSGNGLCMYEDETKIALSCQIIIDHDTNISCSDENEKALIFSITCPNAGVYAFRAKCLDSLVKWLNKLLQKLYPSNGISIDDFEIISELGRGSYGKVMLAKYKKTDELVAIKSIHKKFLIDKHQVNTVLTEREILMKVDCPYIIKLLFSFQSPSKFYLVLEYSSGGDLFSHLRNSGRFTLDDIRIYIAELAVAIHHLHKNSIIYRDLKPENVLFCADGHLKLTDFGISKILKQHSDTTSTMCGTKEYIAPEEILGNQYGYAVDWWQLGILLYEIIARHTPFANENTQTLFKNILSRNVALFPIRDPGAKSLIGHLLKKDPKERACFKDIHASPFFEGFDWDTIANHSAKCAYIPDDFSSDDCVNCDAECQGERPCESYVMPVMERFENFSYTDKRFAQAVE